MKGIIKGINLFLTGTVVLALLTGCSKDKDTDKKNPELVANFLNPFAGSPDVPAENLIKIVDENGLPIGGAQVLIGDALGAPFENNLINANENGEVVLPAQWTTEQSLTLNHAGHTRVTYLKQLPGARTYVMKTAMPDVAFTLTGTNTGFSIVNKDGKADFSFVMPALTKKELFNFDMGMIISNENDDIEIAGNPVSIPTNVTLPKQKESYFIPITLEKPQYKVQFKTKGVKKVFSARGQFPFKQVVSAMRSNKEFFELINYFSIQGGSLKDVNIANQNTQMDLPVNEMNFTQSRFLVAPAYRTEEALVAAAISGLQGYMFPTDVKNVDAGQMVGLASLPGADINLLAILKRKTELKQGPGSDRISASFVPFTDRVKPTLLPLMNNPRIMSYHTVQVQHIEPVVGLQPVATYAVLSKVDVRKSGNYQYENLTQLWEVYGSNWVDQVAVPVWPGESAPAGKLRWSVALLAGGSVQNLDLGPKILDAVTHATNASADF
ncbi:MAG: hypothetical protein BroJett040_25110 [Oligoflexia bacterium]|nr:MAG: hypothetical protein BroJett040_25110 [Oligoflexia bacterium]